MIPNKFISPIRQAAVFCLLASALIAGAAEYPIGKPRQHFGMEIAAVYLQPVAMEPEGMMRKAEESDIRCWCSLWRCW
jgi:periplasmic iron binding protein